MSIRSCIVLLSMCLILPSYAARAQDCSHAWQQKYPIGRWLPAAAYDSQRGVLVVFGGQGSCDTMLSDTWEWDGTTWMVKNSQGPAARAGHQMVYDSARHLTVLFGGGGTNETWEWDGTSWTQRTPAHSPSARNFHSMVYDSARQVTLLFGGWETSLAQGSNETWEYDGSDWTLKSPADSPDLRWTAGMSFDSSRGKAVLFGGYNHSNGAFGDTWEWDGTNWSEANPAHHPVAADRRSMAFDTARGVTVLLSVEYIYPAWTPQTWEWDGTDWTQRNTIETPGARDNPVLAFDSNIQRVLVFGGYDYQEGRYSNSFWSWDGTAGTWEIESQAPAPRVYMSMVYDSHRNVSVLFGGQNPSGYYLTPLADTWEHDGTAWIKRNPVTSPPILSSYAMAFDSDRNVTVIYGGGAYTANLSTWEWNGTDWAEASPANNPGTVYDGAMAYDAARHESVLFGGYDEYGQTVNNTWVYNGTDWTQKTPAHSPSARIYTAMTYDPVREKVVLYGGSLSPADLSAWEWDGSYWTEVPATPNPGETERANILYSPDLGRLIHFGGMDNVTWSWDGSAWGDLQVGGSTPHRAAGAAYDISRHGAILFGGFSGAGNQALGDTWILNVSDQDLDGTLDCADGCPADPLKIAPGICGCGVPDVDDDGDLTLNCLDDCPSDPLKTDPGACGCGVADTDTDSDGAPDCTDACDSDPLKTAPGICGCGISDLDSDGDSTPNCNDLCPADSQKTSAGVCGCGVSDADTDQDGTPNCNDSCAADPQKTAPGICGCGVSDADTGGNGIADCVDEQITSVTPAKPGLKLKKKSVQVTMTPWQGVKYVIQYRWLTGNKKKDKKVKYRSKTVLTPSASVKGAKTGLRLALSYHYLVEGPAAFESLESAQARLKIKKLPGK